ncbi:MAG: ABC transporter ATP-binding protein [Actinomycetaceae bacterium]|nr:ABC transporter ATP-binding protein [Actinomycetaceae bacterium]
MTAKHKAHVSSQRTNGGDSEQGTGESDLLSSADVVIRTSRLSKSFSHGGAQQHVLRNLDLTIEKGSFTVIMGPSGAGKSTLLYTLSGMDRPTLGRVEVDGIEISTLNEDHLAIFRRQHCGFVFQQVHLLDDLSVIDNLMVVGLLSKEKRRHIRGRCEELLNLVGLPDSDWRKFPSMLSGGQAQRVAIARALVGTPTVLFADEPTGQLSSQYADMVLDLLEQIHLQGQTIVMVTHDVRSAARASRILYLRDGKVHGELDLESFSGAPLGERTQCVTTFLAEMGW